MSISAFNYTTVLNQPIEFATALKTLPTKGNMVYEYNPFRNYRIDEDCYKYDNKLWSAKDLVQELTGEIRSQSKAIEYIKSLGTSWVDAKGKKLIPADKEDPELVEAGDLTDFNTNELKFDLNHPVDILPQYSYDGSVNLILNDGTNQPRLINSRFSALGRNQYQIVDRKGNNDTNIYDRGSQFDIDTSLYKKVIEIPTLTFNGVINGGQMSVGNYHFYFRYTDSDDNETDFVAESGLVSLFIGNDPSSIRSGWRNENSHKAIRFTLSNIDSAYQYVNVYYTKATSDIDQNSVTSVFKINQKFVVSSALDCDIVITGYEEKVEITTSELNPLYQTADSVFTQAQCQNLLFFGNITTPTVPYSDLEQLSLRFLPFLEDSKTYDLVIDSDYNIESESSGYYDPKFIYHNVGYWNHEFYRLGIVYILSNNSLSPVFNIRGIDKLNTNPSYTLQQLLDGSKIQQLSIEEETYQILGENSKNTNLENSKGVIHLEGDSSNTQKIFGIGIKTDADTIKYLKNTLNIKGFFFVRQKRIPTILCQAYTIGIDPVSRTPVLPVSEGYITESFLDSDKKLVNDFDSRKYTFKNKDHVKSYGAICPEYDVDTPYYNSLFTGDQFSIQESDTQPINQYLQSTSRNFILSDKTFDSANYREQASDSLKNIKIIGVEDDVKLVAIGDTTFAARAGEAEEAFRYEYIERENKITDATNLIRGSYGPYLGITGYKEVGKLIDIKIPGFSSLTNEAIFKIRYNDKSPYYAISDRISLNKIEDWFEAGNTQEELQCREYALTNTLYRGDCYICQFTHRVNRNFQDPSAPVNDRIVDPDCWDDNYEVKDGVVQKDKFTDINLGDVNAIKLGMWITLPIRSTKNLNIRATNDSMTDEQSLTGHARGFYPYLPLSANGIYKVPEALCYNKGFEKSVSERYNFEEPNVPAIKNDFTNRIAYSDVHVNDAFKNGFRVFQATHYKDYPKTYGQITKIVEFRGTLVCVFEHGVSLISVNERAIAGKGTSGEIYINTSNVLPDNPKVLSDTFGSQWRESVIKTPSAVYGVDTVAKKIWRTSGDSFECISDFKVQEFLNNNISLTESEIDPIIGIRNVKTHYNAYKRDVMFTFYDNLHGFEEKVWNLCWNELQQKWITFYSWVPSYSENIYNQFFSFDRNTSKWIAKLGVSHSDNDFSDGVVLSHNIIQVSNELSQKSIGTLSFVNRNLESTDNIIYTITYTLEHDNYGNYKNFEIKNGELYAKNKYSSYCSELYVRKGSSNELTDLSDTTQYAEWENSTRNDTLAISKDDCGKRKMLTTPYNSSQLVYLLNIKAHVFITYKNVTEEAQNIHKAEVNNGMKVDGGQYESVVAVISNYNEQFLSTDFWKHGQAGIIDCADDIYPTYWYGQQHPFEFEFVVADNPDIHKIFDDLVIISNNAEPESFHYEIVGDVYDFAEDKKNMYIRQEATKELYQFNGSDVTYDTDYSDLSATHRTFTAANGATQYDKSTLFPLYYSRVDTINEIADSYYNKEDSSKNRDYSALAGGEIIRYKTLDEYRIWNHVKAVNMSDPEKGRLRGNMQYKEGVWDVQINPLNFVQKNEKQWGSEDITGATNLNSSKIPIELGQSPVPNEVKDTINRGDLTIPSNSSDRAITKWKWQESQNKEVKIKDKWVKVRIRYTGNKLAIIQGVKTLYSISYS